MKNTGAQQTLPMHTNSTLANLDGGVVSQTVEGNEAQGR